MMQRTNGLQTPYNGMQISTWILLPLLIIQFCVFVTPSFPLYISIPATVLFLLFGFGSAYYGYITTKTNSIDTMLYQHLNGRPHPRAEADKAARKKRKLKAAIEAAKKNGGGSRAKSGFTENPTPPKSPAHNVLGATVGGIVSLVRGSNGNALSTNESIEMQHNQACIDCEVREGAEEDDGEPATKYCWVCQTDVYESSMHCKYCDKCVSTFDHHCMWLNNCIGDANYETFFKTVWSTFLFVTVHSISLILYLSLYFGGQADTVRLARKWMGANQPLVVVGVNIAFLVLTLSASIMVAQLLVFHIGLRNERITTYQYIIRDGQRKREQWKIKQKVRARRVQELERSRAHGTSCQTCWFQVGGIGFCKTCDPIIKMVKEDMENEERNANTNASRLGQNDDDEEEEDSDESEDSIELQEEGLVKR